MHIGLKKGASGAEVKRFHRVLRAAGFKVEAEERRQSAFGPSTHAALKELQTQNGLTSHGRIDKKTLALLEALEAGLADNAPPVISPPPAPLPTNGNQGNVHGNFVDEDGAAIVGAAISLFAQGVRDRSQLASSTTDGSGAFVLTYQRTAPVNLVVQGLAPNSKLAAESAVLFSADADVEIDLTTAPGGIVPTPAAYTVLSGAVAKQLLKTPLPDLTQDKDSQEVTFVANAVGASFDDVAHLYLASRMAAPNKLSELTLYGIFSQGIPAPLDAALADLPDAGIDAAFVAQVLTGVLAHASATLAGALGAALAANVLPASYATQQDAELANLDALRVQAVGSAPYIRGKTPLNDLLAAGNVDDAVRTAFTQAYAASGGRLGPTWKSLRADKAFTKAQLATLNTTLLVGPLLGGNLLLVKDTLQRLTAGSLASVQNLALLDQADWTSRIENIDPPATSIPPVLPDDTPALRIARLAKALAERFASRYPTTAFVGSLTKAQTSSFTAKAELISVLSANPKLDLRRTSIDQYIVKNQLRVSAPALAELKIVQRLQRLSPHYATVEALNTAGYQSAQAIYFAGRVPFVAQLTPLMGSAPLADAAWQRAQTGYASALAAYGRFNLALNGTSFALTASPVPPPSAVANLPDLQVLFGSLDYCACSDCRSVLSPAAYLVDLLQFLKARAAASPFTHALDALLARRPDLQFIALGCENTDVTLPYIDVVNELLESVIAPPATPLTLICATGDSDERRALPQQISLAAYVKTAGAVFPLSLPFDLSFAQTAAFVNALGASLDQLMRVCGSGSAASQAAAQLGLNPAMLAVVNGTDSHQPWERWGFASANPASVIDPKTRAPLNPPPTDWIAAMSHVPVLLGRAGLSFAQLCQVLEATWVAAGTLTLAMGTTTYGSEQVLSCDTEQMTLAGLDAAALDRINRFLRLWSATQLQMWELDWALTTKGGTLDDAFLVFLASTLALRQRLGLPLQELLCFWGPMPTQDVTNLLGDADAVVPSTYSSVFLNPTVHASWSAVFVAPGALSGGPLNLNAIKAALGLSADDVAAILAATGAANALSLDTLNVLLRHARLASSLTLTVPDLLLWIALTDDKPFGTGTAPADTAEFLRRLAVLQGTGIAAHDLDYLLRAGPATESALAFTPVQSTAVLQTIRDAIAKLTPAAQADAPTVATIFIDALATATGASANVVTPVLANTGVLPLAPATIALLLGQNTGVDATAFPQLVAGVTRVANAAALFADLQTSESEFVFTVQNAASFNWLDASALPLSAPATSLYLPFERLLRALTLNRRQGASAPKLFDVLSSWVTALPADLGSAISGNGGALATALNASVPDLSTLATALAATTPSLNAATQAGTLADMAMLAALAAALDAAAQYKIGAGTLVQLAAAPPTNDSATAAMGVFQARYAPSAWFGAVQPIEDGLREMRRDALVAYLIGQGPVVALAPGDFVGIPPLLSSDDIFDYYLIDPEMCACGITTRLLEASLAVQQFVQQCQLGLVPTVTFDAAAYPGWTEWSWMSQFRLWQANRQVFLYPENYLLPELRTDKSPFFADLESDLAQSNCDADAVTAAFENYLRKLVQVRNLVVAAHYHETRADASGVLHVLHLFARTRGTPPQWYYRTRTGVSTGSGIWSAWQALNLDIASDQVVPVVWDQRLHLVWPIFKQISEKASTQTIPTTSGGNANPSSMQPANKYWTVEFAMSERSAGQWQAKRTYAEKCFFNGQKSPLEFTFRAFQDARFNLQLEVYMDADLAATATLTMPEAPLAVYQLPMDHFAEVDPSTIDLTQEPSIALIGPMSEDGGLTRPTMDYQFTGQALTWMSSTAYQLHPLTLLAASGKTLVAQKVLGQIDSQRIVFPLQELVFDSADPFFVADSARTYFVQPHYYTVSSSPTELDNLAYIPQWTTSYAFQPFYHPFARTFLRELEIGGTDQLMQRKLQINPQVVRGQGSYDFNTQYKPQPPVLNTVTNPYPVEDVDFTVSGAYALYNWELFYHAPMYVAAQLMANQQYQAAMQWLQYIFNPTDASASPVPGHFWVTRPFYEMNASDWLAQQITTILTTLAADGDQNTTAALNDWLAHPFDPHRVARLRIGAYGKAAVMKFLDNLIAWGDSLYAQYTMEKVAQAEQLYVFADLILGPQPDEVRLRDKDVTPGPDATTYALIEGGLDKFSNELVAVENVIAAPTTVLQSSGAVSQAPPLPQISTLFFCIPPNDQLLAYWSTVADRLYKIRHCLNLQGVAQPLPLYAPPINPLQLIAQAAGGAGSFGALTFTPVYRFAVYLERALELTNDVRAYGALVLAALEKKDAEALATLRANQDVDIQTRLLDIKNAAVTEAQDQITALQNQKTVVQIRHDFYANIAFMNDWEAAAITLQLSALTANGAAVVLDMTASATHLLPRYTFGAAGFGGSPMATITYGGEQVGNSAASWASSLRSVASIVNEAGGMSATMGGYQRRQDDWTLQANLAAAELTQLDSQIAAANDRLAMANSEVDLQTRQIANAQAVSGFLTGKYTNAQLYDWMLTQLTTVHTQAYQLAFGLAQQAQAAYQYELGSQDSFIQFGYWDSQHKGLTAGESLLFDLRRMQAQYLQANTREFELVKHVSLALTQPMALVQLLQTGTCNIALDEALFDLDHPGHYFRRLRSVALTVPCVTGPYSGVNATLVLDQATVRVQAPVSPYTPASAATPPSGPAFVTSPAPATASISTSHGQNDAGLFDVSLRDERWLPFEGQGAISTWTLVLDPRDNSFDLSTITDVVLHLRYTARSAGASTEAVRQALKPLGQRQIMLSVRSSFSDAYYAFFNPPDTTATQQTLTLPLLANVLPFSNLGTPTITDVAVYLALEQEPATGTTIAASFGATGGTANPVSIAQVPGSTGGGTAIAALGADAGLTGAQPPGSYTLTIPEASVPPAPLGVISNGHNRLNVAAIQDIVLVISYKIV
ncbi:MAG: neuraminidase-like domain-containing protein [Rhodoferax sp.]